MHRTDGDGHVDHRFSNGDPALGVKGTKAEQEWFNAVQEELCNLLEGMGVTLVKGDWTQLLDACVSAATAEKIVRRDANGRAQFADPSADADAVTKGWVATPPGWSSMTLQANWTGTLQYRKDNAGVVWIKGKALVPAAGAGAFVELNQLPAGYRPAYEENIPIPCYDQDAGTTPVIGRLHREVAEEHIALYAFTVGHHYDFLICFRPEA